MTLERRLIDLKGFGSSVKDSKEELKKILREKRAEANLSLHELEAESKRLQEEGKGLAFSASYYCQVEKGGIDIERVSFDLLWTVAQIFGLDPVCLYVLSRPSLNQDLGEEKNREELFKKTVAPSIQADGYYVVLSKNPLRYLHARGFAVEKKSQAKIYTGTRRGYGHAKRAVEFAVENRWPSAYVVEVKH